MANTIICDFCSNKNPTWDYPASDFEYKPDNFSSVGEGSRGNWAACETCHRMIERGDYRALAVHSAKRLAKEKLGGMDYRPLVKGLASRHQGFKDHRTGPPRLLSEEERQEVPPAPAWSIESAVPPGQNNPIGTEPPVIRHMEKIGEDETTETYYSPEGYSADQLRDPKVLRSILAATGRQDAVDSLDLTQGLTRPLVIKPHWEGERTYHRVLSACIGELPRREDRWQPTPPMMNSQQISEPLSLAHPVIIEPNQMDAIDDEDWSLPEAHDYARMAHLPFEPIYLDFGGYHNEGLHIDCTLGTADLKGALVWRDEWMWKGGPTLGVAPFGAWKYLNQTIPKYIKEKYGLTEEQLIHACGGSYFYDGKFSHPDTQGRLVDPKAALAQWAYQTPGLMFFGPSFGAGRAMPWATHTLDLRNAGGIQQVERVFAFPQAFSLIDDERIRNDDEAGKLGMIAITGLRELGVRTVATDEGHELQATPLVNAFKEMVALNAELIGRMVERAMLGLYFIENAPVEITPVALSRQVRRDMERKGRDKVASIVVIRPSSGSKRRDTHQEPSEREYKYRWERRGYFMHIHENNRHYQNRPDLVKPCHRCEREFAKGTEGVESPDCIKKWIDPVVCGPADKPLKQKVRIKRHKDDPDAEAA